MQSLPMKRHEERAEGDRYQFDWGLCRDFAQVNTSEDAAFHMSSAASG